MADDLRRAALRDDEFADWLHFVSDSGAEMPEDEVVAAFERALIELKALRLVADAAERVRDNARNKTLDRTAFDALHQTLIAAGRPYVGKPAPGRQP